MQPDSGSTRLCGVEVPRRSAMLGLVTYTVTRAMYSQATDVPARLGGRSSRIGDGWNDLLPDTLAFLGGVPGLSREDDPDDDIRKDDKHCCLTIVSANVRAPRDRERRPTELLRCPRAVLAREAFEEGFSVVGIP